MYVIINCKHELWLDHSNTWIMSVLNHAIAALVQLKEWSASSGSATWSCPKWRSSSVSASCSQIRFSGWSILKQERVWGHKWVSSKGFLGYLFEIGWDVRSSGRDSESLLLHIEKNQVRRLRHLARMPEPGGVPAGGFWVRPTGRKSRRNPRTHAVGSMFLGWTGNAGISP